MPNDEFVDLACELLFPAIGALGTNYSFNYWFDGARHSFSFSTLIVGEASKGKSLLINAVEEAIRPLREQDEKAQEVQDNYERAMEQYTRLGGGEIPDAPDTVFRVCGSVISRTALLKMMKKAKKKHLLQVTEEFGENIYNNKKDYGVPTYVFNRAFDNSIVNAQFVGADFNAGNVPAYLNGAYTGQPNCMEYFTAQKYGDNINNGLASRWYLDCLPDGGIRAKRIRAYTADEENAIHAMSLQLMQSPQTTLYYPFIDDAAEQWWDKMQKIYMQTLSHTIDYVINRDAVMFTRMAYMLAVLYGIISYCPGEPARTSAEDKEKEQAVVSWATYFAERLVIKQLKFLGETIESAVALQFMPPKLKDVYAALPDEFTRQELVALLPQTKKTSPSRPIKEWREGGYIESIECPRINGRRNVHYRKIIRN